MIIMPIASLLSNECMCCPSNPNVITCSIQSLSTLSWLYMKLYIGPIILVSEPPLYLSTFTLESTTHKSLRPFQQLTNPTEYVLNSKDSSQISI